MMRQTSLSRLILASALALAPLPQTAAIAATEAASGDRLVGLWTAKKRLGPDLRGPIILVHKRDGWTADFGGRSYRLSLSKGELKFALPTGKGSFALREPRSGSAAVGHWTSRISPVHLNPFTVPVELRPDGPSRWRGEVAPMDDTVTFYLKIEKGPDGSLHAFLRNPERNFSIDRDVDELKVSGEDVSLLGHGYNGTGPHAQLFTGRYERQADVLLVTIPWTGDDVYQFERDTDEQSGFYPRSSRPVRYHYQPPPQLGDGWPVASLEQVGMSRKAIESFIQYIIDMPMTSVHTPEVEGVLVARHGKLVLEEYFHGFDRDILHETRSAAKSVTSVVVGAALHGGLPLKLSDPVYKVMNGGSFAPGLDPRKRDMTLEHLLMMRSGYFCDDSNPDAPGNEDLMQEKSFSGEAPDNIQYTLKVPMAFEPGEVAIYCSASPNLALAMTGRAAGMSPLDIFDRLVAAPLDIHRYSWPLDRAGNPYGGGGVRLLPRDFLKMAQMMMDGGTWNGRRVVSKDYAARASAPLHKLNSIRYGYLWWSIDFPYRNRTVRAFFAGGNGGQTVMAIPELDLAIGMFAGNYRDPVGLHVQEDLPANYIVPAVLQPGEDPNTGIPPGTFHTPYGRPKIPERE